MSRNQHTSSRLRHRLTLQQEMRTADDAGGYVRSWQDVADLWAEIFPISGEKKPYAAQLQAEISHRIVIRYRTGIDAGQRLLLGNRVFDIRSVMIVKEKNEVIEVLAREGTIT